MSSLAAPDAPSASSIVGYPRPGILLGAAPEASPKPVGATSRWEQALTRFATRGGTPTFSGFRRRIEAIRGEAESLDSLSASGFAARVAELRAQLAGGVDLDRLHEQAFAMVLLMCRRHLGLVAHDEQLYAGWLILHGVLAEMATGEGKTLTCAFPAAAAGLAGTPVHVVTVNDYLVDRDSAFLAPVFQNLGLSVGRITERCSPQQRKRAYAADITYVSNKQLIFDYLRDRQHLGSQPNGLRDRLGPLISGVAERRMQRGLCFAILDEADSVLIDDAKTPFILSRPLAEAGNATEYTVALGIARRLREEEHFLLNGQGVRFTDAGLRRLDELTSALSNRWRNARFRREMVEQAVLALHLYVRDKHYVVKDGAVILIDETTGRPVPDRSLPHGLHQMVQIKERSTVTQPTATTGRLSYQRFFGRYLRIGGMTGTAWEVRREIRAVYGMPVQRVPTHRPRQVEHGGVRIFPTLTRKYRYLLAMVANLHEQGRPVLIGTRSVAESEQLGRTLEQGGYRAQVLNANHDSRESEIVTLAGQSGQIVVATNMAGRGTDIPLGPGVAELGGLHVISVHLNDSARIDRQLFGRCGRQGDPGSCEAILSLEDDVFADTFPPIVLDVLRGFANRGGRVWRLITPVIVALAQGIRTRRARRLRTAVRRADERLDSLLSFTANRS